MRFHQSTLNVEVGEIVGKLEELQTDSHADAQTHELTSSICGAKDLSRGSHVAAMGGIGIMILWWFYQIDDIIHRVQS